jgi:ankyrin repeat protein
VARRRLVLAFLGVAVASVVTACAAPGASSADATVTDDGLHAAAAAGDLATIHGLVARGVDLDARDDAGRTPLMAATVARQAGTVRILLEAGADVDIRDDRLDNPFLYAGAEGLLDILKLANEAGADPALTNRFGGTALIPASERGHVEVVRYLLEETDVDVDHVNNLGWTALLEAVILGNGGPAHQAIVTMLLHAGADPELADRDGVTPLGHARARGQTEVAAMLVDAGAER